MKSFNKNNYTNFLDKSNLSIAHIKEQIKTMKLQFIPTRNQEVEWKIKFPMFVTAFYSYIINNLNIPTQAQFFDYYLHVNDAWFRTQSFSTTIMEGLKARVYRTYPSLIRDLHMMHLVKERLLDCVVMYNEVLDIEEGIDLMVIDNESYHAINLYTDTTNGVNARTKKSSRHDNFDNVRYLELPVAFRGSERCGDFYLYGDREIQKIGELTNIVPHNGIDNISSYSPAESGKITNPRN